MEKYKDMTKGELLQAIPWEETGFGDEDLVAIADEWDKVRLAAGEGSLERALARADSNPLKLDSTEGLPHLFPRFVSLAGWLQVANGESLIFLPCDEVAKVLSCSPRTVSTLRSLALGLGYLEEVKPHDFGRRRATEFRFDVSRFPELRKR